MSDYRYCPFKQTPIVCDETCALYLEPSEAGAPTVGGGCSFRVIAASLAETEETFAAMVASITE